MYIWALWLYVSLNYSFTFNEIWKSNSVFYFYIGILDSQVSLNASGNGKNFVIKDKTGNLRYSTIK